MNKTIYALMYEREAPLTHKCLSLHENKKELQEEKNSLTGERKRYSYIIEVTAEHIEKLFS